MRITPVRALQFTAAALLTTLLTACPVAPSTSEAELAVAVVGPGAGLVTSEPAGIDCGTVCAGSFEVGSAVVLTADPDPGSVFESWDGCDEVVANACTVQVTADAVMTATFAMPDGDDDEDGGDETPDTGALVVDFAGLPEPWQHEGYATIHAPDGSDTAVLWESTFDDLPVGTYQITAHPLSICDVEFLPVNPSVDVDVTVGVTTEVTLEYAAAEVTALGYRAIVIGVHSNANPIFLFATFVREGPLLKTFGCVRYYETGTGYAEAFLRGGLAKDHFVDEGSVVATLSVFAAECGDPEDDDIAPAELWCEDHIDGTHVLTAEEAAAFDAGSSYFHVPFAASEFGHLVAQIVPDGSDAPPGGDLEVVIDEATLPEELLGGFEVCVDGIFWLDRLQGSVDPVCIQTGSALFEDLISFDYVAFVEPFGPTDVSTLVIEGSPAEVRTGTTHTIRVYHQADDE
jgi:hypothetical protein